MTYCGDHVRANVIGVVCPAPGESFAMIFDGVDTDVFQAHLDHLTETVPSDPIKRRIFILDNASGTSPKDSTSTTLNDNSCPDFNPHRTPLAVPEGGLLRRLLYRQL